MGTLRRGIASLPRKIVADEPVMAVDRVIYPARPLRCSAQAGKRSLCLGARLVGVGPAGEQAVDRHHSQLRVVVMKQVRLPGFLRDAVPELKRRELVAARSQCIAEIVLDAPAVADLLRRGASRLLVGEREPQVFDRALVVAESLVRQCAPVVENRKLVLIVGRRDCGARLRPHILRRRARQALADRLLEFVLLRQRSGGEQHEQAYSQHKSR